MAGVHKMHRPARKPSKPHKLNWKRMGRVSQRVNKWKNTVLHRLNWAGAVQNSQPSGIRPARD
ncbi:hypothetical protein A2U01_0060273 [Trifolium medium]|uniref:Uncharacterized protein n=1 Tax=Trifolium medium TaxID=97028 RepID=A0A392RSG1_9FABA|nr:hypothetical protein [Trifolium medium]